MGRVVFISDSTGYNTVQCNFFWVLDAKLCSRDGQVEEGDGQAQHSFRWLAKRAQWADEWSTLLSAEMS